MTRRSKFNQVPTDIQEIFHRKLLDNGFSDYTALTAWLNELGYEITRSTVHREGKSFQARVEKLKYVTDQAKYFSQEVGDDEGAVNDALIRRYQGLIWDIVGQFEDADLDPKAINLASLGKTVAELTRASISQKKWAAAAREKMNAKFAELEQQGKKGQLDMATLKRVREEIYGIV